MLLNSIMSLWREVVARASEEGVDSVGNELAVLLVLQESLSSAIRLPSDGPSACLQHF